MKHTLLMVVVIAIWFGAGYRWGAASAKDTRFKVGHTYAVIYECAAEPLTVLGANGDHRQVPLCYSEPLTIREVYDDGWILAVDAREGSKAKTWMVNTAAQPFTMPGERLAAR